MLSECLSGSARPSITKEACEHPKAPGVQLRQCKSVENVTKVQGVAVEQLAPSSKKIWISQTQCEFGQVNTCLTNLMCINILVALQLTWFDGIQKNASMCCADKTCIH